MIEAGLAISALLGGFIAAYSLKYVMVASIVPQLICLAISFFTIEPKSHTQEISENIFSHMKEAWKAFVKNTKLQKLSLAYILDYGMEETNYQFKPAFNALLWPTWALGIARSLDNIFGFLGYHFAGKIIDKFTPIKTLLSQQIIGKVNRFLFIGYPNILSPFMLSVNAFFFGVGTTANQTLLHKEFTNKQRATMGSINALGGSLFFSIFAFIMGTVADHFGLIKTLLLIEVLSVFTILIYWNLFKKHKK